MPNGIKVHTLYTAKSPNDKQSRDYPRELGAILEKSKSLNNKNEQKQNLDNLKKLIDDIEIYKQQIITDDEQKGAIISDDSLIIKKVEDNKKLKNSLVTVVDKFSIENIPFSNLSDHTKQCLSYLKTKQIQPRDRYWPLDILKKFVRSGSPNNAVSQIKEYVKSDNLLKDFLTKKIEEKLYSGDESFWTGEAKHRLGELYLSGEIINKDEKKATKLLGKNSLVICRMRTESLLEPLPKDIELLRERQSELENGKHLLLFHRIGKKSFEKSFRECGKVIHGYNQALKSCTTASRNNRKAFENHNQEAFENKEKKEFVHKNIKDIKSRILETARLGISEHGQIRKTEGRNHLINAYYYKTILNNTSKKSENFATVEKEYNKAFNLVVKKLTLHFLDRINIEARLNKIGRYVKEFVDCFDNKALDKLTNSKGQKILDVLRDKYKNYSKDYRIKFDNALNKNLRKDNHILHKPGLRIGDKNIRFDSLLSFPVNSEDNKEIGNNPPQTLVTQSNSTSFHQGIQAALEESKSSRY